MTKESAGGALVIAIDYATNHEEAWARESSREHCGKRGIVVHGSLANCKDNNDNVFKRALCVPPEGDCTQDDNHALLSLDAM